MNLNATCVSGSTLISEGLNQMVNCSLDWTDAMHGPWPDVQSVLYLIALAIIVVASLTGNLLVLVAIIWTPRLHRTNNALMVSLAVADLLRTATVMPIHGYLWLTTANTEITTTRGNVLCPIHYALLVGLDVVAALSVTLIGIERVFIIVRPLRYICTVTRAKLCLTIGGMWAVGFVNGLIHIIRPHDNITVQTSLPSSLTLTSVDRKTCRQQMTSASDAISHFLFLFAIPLVVIVGCYGKIFLVVGHQIRRFTNPTVNPNNTRDQPSESRWPQPEKTSQCHHENNGGGQLEGGGGGGSPPIAWAAVATGRSVGGSRADGIQTGRLQSVARTVGSDLIVSSLASVREETKVINQLRDKIPPPLKLSMQRHRSRALHHPVMPIILENCWKKCSKNKVTPPPVQSAPIIRLRPQCTPLEYETITHRSKPSADRLKVLRSAKRGKSLEIAIEKSHRTSDVIGMRTRDMLRHDDVFKMVELRAGQPDRGRRLSLRFTGKGGGQVTPGPSEEDVLSRQSGSRKLSDQFCPSVSLCIDSPAVRSSDYGVRCDYSGCGRPTSCVAAINSRSHIGALGSNGSNIINNGNTGYKVSGGRGFAGVFDDGERCAGRGCGFHGGSGACDVHGRGVAGSDTLRINDETKTNLSTNGVKNDSLELSRSVAQLLSPIQSTKSRFVPLMRLDPPPFQTTAPSLSIKPGLRFTWAAASSRKELAFPRSGLAPIGICRPIFAPSPRSPRRLITNPFAQTFDHHRPSTPFSPPPALHRTESVSSRTTISSILGSARPSLLIRLTGNRALKMMFVVVSSFLLGWLPLQICHVLSFFCSEDLAPSSAAWGVAELCVFLASALHPLIYDFYSSEFRRALRSVLWPRRRTCTSGSMAAAVEG